jgi:hypothetical protein
MAFFIGAIFAPTAASRLGLEACGIGIGLIAPVFRSFFPKRYNMVMPVNVEHLTERFALFSIIIIGETIISLLFVEGGTFTTEEWVAAMLGMVIAFCLQWIWFDIENGHHGLPLKSHALRRGGWRTLIWIFSHIFCDLGIICLAAGIWNVHHFYGALDAVGSHRASTPSSGGPLILLNGTNLTAFCANFTVVDPALDPYCTDDPFLYGRWILNIGAAASLLFITINGAMHERKNVDRHYLNKPLRIAIRVAFVVFLGLISLAGPLLTPLEYLGIVVAIFGSQVLLGLEHRKSVEKIRKLRSMSRAPEMVKKDEEVEKVNDLLEKLGMHGSDLNRVLSVQFGDQRVSVSHLRESDD